MPAVLYTCNRIEGRYSVRCNYIKHITTIITAFLRLLISAIWLGYFFDVIKVSNQEFMYSELLMIAIAICISLSWVTAGCAWV